MTRTVVIHSLDHAPAALAAATELRVKELILFSAEGAVANAGPAWFRKLAEIAQKEFPRVKVTAVLDCGDMPGYALAAFRAGCTAIRFTGHRPFKTKIRAIAKAYGASVVDRPRHMLDLMGESDPEAACRAWLTRGTPKARQTKAKSRRVTGSRKR